jgi:hypothetical protein
VIAVLTRGEIVGPGIRSHMYKFKRRNKGKNSLKYLSHVLVRIDSGGIYLYITFCQSFRGGDRFQVGNSLLALRFG